MASNLPPSEPQETQNEYRGFGKFKFKMAESLTTRVVVQLATVFEYPSGVTEELMKSKESAGYSLLSLMEEKGHINRSDITQLLHGLKITDNNGVAEEAQSLYEKYVEVVPLQSGPHSVTNIKSMRYQEMEREYPYFERKDYPHLEQGSLQREDQRAKQRFNERMTNYSLECNRGIFQTNTPNNDITIAVIGQTGDGKSSTCNTIMGQQYFAVDKSGAPVTRKSDVASFVLNGKTITVVDTPGILDTTSDRVTMAKELVRVLYLLREVNVFVFVVNASSTRFTARDEETWSQLEDVYRNFKKYCLLVYTKAETEMEDGSLDEFVKKQKENDTLNMLMGDIDWRVAAINNRARIPAEQTHHRNVLISMANKIVEGNRRIGQPESYSDEGLKKASEMEMEIRSAAGAHDCLPFIIDAAIDVYIREPENTRNADVFLERVIHSMESDGHSVPRERFDEQVRFMHDTLAEKFSKFGEIFARSFLNSNATMYVRETLTAMRVPAPVMSILTWFFISPLALDQAKE